MFTSLMVSAITLGVPLPESGRIDASPIKEVELFAKEAWYQEQEGKEQEFVGILKKKGGKPAIGFGRNNPFTLEMDKDIREVYMGGQLDRLDPYVGKKVKFIGKPVELGVEGRRHREIWPARLFVYLSAGDQAGRDLKIHARGNWPYGSADPDKPQKPITLVLREASELVTATPFNNLDAVPAVVEKMATAEVAKYLKVKTIDWSKQMLIVATAGTQRTGGYKVEIHAVHDGDKKLLVTWTVTPPEGIATDAFTHPGVVALVDRSAKPAEFIQPKAPKLRLNPRATPPRAKPEEDTEIEDSPAIVAQDKANKNGAEGKGLKILARTNARLANASIVLRSPEDLVKARGAKGDAEQAVAEAAKQFKVDGIDFKKQMIIVVSGGVQRTGGYSVEVKGLKLKDKALIVQWKLHSPKPGGIVTQALTHPAQTILVERFDGEVRFEPPPPKGLGKKLGGNPE